VKIGGWLLIALSIFTGVATLAIFVVVLVKGIHETQKGALYLDTAEPRVVMLEAGEYTVFLEGEPEEGGAGDISHLHVEGQGEKLNIQQASGSRYSVKGRRGRSVARFQVARGGEYRVETGFEPRGCRYVVIRNFMGSVLKTVLGSFAVIFGGLFLSIGLLGGGIAMVVRKKRAAAP